MKTLVWLAYPLIAILLLTQALWIFHDARKRGENAWLWGLLGFIKCPFVPYRLPVSDEKEKEQSALSGLNRSFEVPVKRAGYNAKGRPKNKVEEEKEEHFKGIRGWTASNLTTGKVANPQ